MAGNTKEYFVVDASFVLSYLFPDEKSDVADEFFRKLAKDEVHCFSTVLFPLEVLNTLKVGVLRKRINNDFALSLAEQFFRYAIPTETVDLQKTFNLALQENLTVYDASYVALAREKQFPLLTSDAKLKKLAAKK